MSYADIVLEHFHAPRNQRVMERPDAIGIAGEPGRGNFMVIYLRVESERIVEASFQTHGCCPSIAAGSWLTSEIVGGTMNSAAGWTDGAIDTALGGLPPHKKHCAALAAMALHRAIGRLGAAKSEQS